MEGRSPKKKIRNFGEGELENSRSKDPNERRKNDKGRFRKYLDTLDEEDQINLMQTFLPFESFEESAKVLDMKRLGKQRVEVYQILRTLTNPRSKGWANHPAVTMWKGCEGTLAQYGMVCCAEWIRRGYKDTLTPKIQEYIMLSGSVPEWLGLEKLHKSHRSALLYKHSEWYNQFGWNEKPELNYWWPYVQKISQY